ncbi:hypothetical protein JX265_011534 [Neoarthrinium moseri]|uniref:Carbohydrate kinase PfkB domain-containing protein n=1 Tax=Neoarthrinium moseri TaxID=1658444 RepID=A0A9P9WC84_9PEZI|nr:uncharacterized protein JN550_011716 [Neoarthrinium moseri]KAI1848612.1 hypothetical protein JX266_005471 [Neoarthrinium moseri]KAI1856575.1 hypothetical protein JX265_011534 [Neoarthrinium moseri]KAI1860032.1 hypothetical protein JN550_011716 [Neoarthrinium moseri]
MEDSPPLHFVSLGMIVLDELHLPSGDILQGYPGGSGAYSTLGARIATEPSNAGEVGSFIMAGHDFPHEIVELIRGWGITITMSVDDARKSTRGLLEYHDNAFGRKTFRYLTTPLQPAAGCLPVELLSSRSFHMLFCPEKVIKEVGDLVRLRSRIGLGERPLLVWEPFPSLCTPERLDEHRQACRHVGIFSPNHLELLGLYGKDTSSFDGSVIESCAESLLQASSPPDVPASGRGIVVRAGEHGCFAVSAQTKFWLPPYHSSSEVVDATGGGNTFLGAFTVTLARTGDLRKAAISGSVAASFAIEQIGLPVKTVTAGRELWNNDMVSTREEFFHY